MGDNPRAKARGFNVSPIQRDILFITTTHHIFNRSNFRFSVIPQCNTLLLDLCDVPRGVC